MEKLSPLQKEFREFFKTLLKIFKVKSPAEIKDENAKKAFFSAIKILWENGKGPVEDFEKRLKGILIGFGLDDLIDDKKIKEYYINLKVKKIYESKFYESPVGKRGRTSEDEAIEFISQNTYLIKELKKIIKKFGGKTVFKVLFEILHKTPLDDDIDKIHLKVKKIKDRMVKKELENNFKGKFFE